MYEIRVEADFAAAHFLKEYHGKCENLHGHNYKVYAHVRGSQLGEGGMLLDFAVLKNALRSVCKRLDHTHLNELVHDGRPVFLDNPSAERIAFYIFTEVQALIGDVPLYAIDVFETPGSRARYIRQE